MVAAILLSTPFYVGVIAICQGHYELAAFSSAFLIVYLAHLAKAS